MADLIKLSSPTTNEFWKIPVLYEDDDLLALDKPICVLSSPDRDEPERPSLIKLLHHDIARGAPWARARSLTYLMNAHRLDFETTGALLFTKNKPALIHLANLFGSEKPNKHYLALVQGEPEQPEFEVRASLAPHPARPGYIRVDERNGKRSRTLFRVTEKFRGYTLLECCPLIGRPHQIRVHLRHVNLPVVADATYGGRLLLLSQFKKNYNLKPGKTERPLLSHTAIHSVQLTFPHPVSKEPVTIDSPIPKHFSVALKYLRKFVSG